MEGVGNLPCDKVFLYLIRSRAFGGTSTSLPCAGSEVFVCVFVCVTKLGWDITLDGIFRQLTLGAGYTVHSYRVGPGLCRGLPAAENWMIVA